MGRETEAPVANNANNLFERVVATRIRKAVEEQIVGVVEDMDFSEEMSETMSEIVNEILSTSSFKNAVKSRVLEIFEEGNLREKFAQKIVSNMLKA